VAAIDTELAAALLAADRAITGAPEVHAREHSVEVQVPFVQVAFPGVRIVAGVVGAVDPATATRLGRVLAATLRHRHPLLVASTDLSHYPRAQDAPRVDLAVLDAIAGMQPEAIAAQVETQMRQAPPGLSTCACGEGAAMVAVSAAAALGAVRGTVVSYAHSGDTVFGEDDRVVGYGAVACTEAGSATTAAGLPASGLAARAELSPAAPAARSAGGPGPAATSGPGPEELDQADRDYLLRLARGTLAQFLQTGTVPLPRASSPALQRPRGVFVTLNEHGRLRGCIGHMAEDTPLQLATARMALEAALRDPRFRPVGADELSQIEVEISVLTPFVRVAGPERFVVGRDGVVLEKSGHRAVYLPQVAPEQGWTRAETLAHLCEKAGLAADCWQEGATLSTFQAQVFAEASSR
jgi:hypothetical protein